MGNERVVDIMIPWKLEAPMSEGYRTWEINSSESSAVNQVVPSDNVNVYNAIRRTRTH